jgi:hypothetical protein
MEPKQSKWRWFFRRPKPGFRGDVQGALGVLAGAGLGAWLFDAWDGFGGAVIGALLVVSFHAIRRGVKRRRAPGRLA